MPYIRAMADDSTEARPTVRRYGAGQWISGAAQTLIVLTCVLYLVTNTLWALLLWEAVTVVYLGVGLIVVWNGSRQPEAGDRTEARAVVKWLWIPPLLAAVVALTRAAALEWGEHGIRANSICPGYILTEMGAATRTDEQIAEWTSYSPLGRLGVPDDVASLALFLASAEASYLTGQALNVTGGMVMH